MGRPSHEDSLCGDASYVYISSGLHSKLRRGGVDWRLASLAKQRRSRQLAFIIDNEFDNKTGSWERG